MVRDPEKAKARQRRYRARRHAEKFGPGAGDQRGRHDNHPTGVRNRRWNPAAIVTSQGYIAVRVPLDHPRGWGPAAGRHRYAYEHVLVAMRVLGRDLNPDEVVHHRNGRRDDNRPENLEVTTRAAHARDHGSYPGARDKYGRFVRGVPRSDLRVQEFPKETV